MKPFNLAALAAFAVLAAASAQAAVDPARMTPEDIAGLNKLGATPGSSGIATISTVLLSGDPTKPGSYTVRLSLPAHTTVQAHSHRDDRAATVISGDWSFGYGQKFDAAALKRLPPGSFYTEPGGVAHFAATGDQGVVIQITGYGPSDTAYVDPAHDPAKR